MKNRLTDLNNILFAQLERLTSEDLTPEEIKSEIARCGSVVDLADKIVDNAKLQLDAVKFASMAGDMRQQLPASLGLPSGEPRA
jgi:hypothetical protein